MIDRFRQWLAEPLLSRMREEHYQQAIDLQREAYRMGRDAGFSAGRALGQLEGQQHTLAELSGFMAERHSPDPELSTADLDRAKARLKH